MPIRTIARTPGRHTGPVRRWSIQLGVLGGSAVGLAALSTLSRPGVVAVTRLHALLEFYSGVFSLVALSLTVMGGLAATERAVFGAHQRVRLQIVHRALAFTSVAFLAFHVLLKVLDKQASLLDAVIPFRSSHRAIPVGLGTIAAYLLVTVLWTGVARARFANSGRPWLWRVLHSLAYVCWPVAMFHGLEAGRAAKPWVVVSYAICLIAVATVLVVRVVGWVTRRTSGPRARPAPVARAAGTASVLPVDWRASGDGHAAMTSGELAISAVAMTNRAASAAPLGPEAGPWPSTGSDVGYAADRPRTVASVPRNPLPSIDRGQRSDTPHRPRGVRTGQRLPAGGAVPLGARDRPATRSHATRDELPPDASDEQFLAFLRGESVR